MRSLSAKTVILLLGLLASGVARAQCDYCGLCPFPTAFASKDSICPGEVVQLGVSGDPPCIWSPLDGLSDPNSCTPSAQPSRTTTYFVESTDAFRHCRWTSSVTVTVFHPPLPTIQAPASASAGEARLSASATPGGASYRWEIVNGAITDGQGEYVVHFSVAARPALIDGSTAVRLSVVEFVEGCPTDPVTVAIPIEPARKTRTMPFR